MYIMRGFSKKTNKYYYQLFIYAEDDQLQHWCYITEKRYNELKALGIKVYERVTNEVK